MSISSVVLILANLVPLMGVLFWEWDTVLVLALFWIENLIIGLFTLFRMSMVGLVQRQPKVFLSVGLFLLHYGIFCAAHGLLLADLLDLAVQATKMSGAQAKGFLSVFYKGAAVFVYFITSLSPAIFFGMAALFLSRLVSFIENFVLTGKAFTSRANKLMTEPYHQIFVLHAGLIGGAILLSWFDSPVWLLALLVLLKMWADYFQFRRRHQVKQGAPTTSHN